MLITTMTHKSRERLKSLRIVTKEREMMKSSVLTPLMALKNLVELTISLNSIGLVTTPETILELGSFAKRLMMYMAEICNQILLLLTILWRKLSMLTRSMIPSLLHMTSKWLKKTFLSVFRSN